jgi:hypothetical protein
MPKLIRENRNSLIENSYNIRNQAFRLVEIPLGMTRGHFSSYRINRNRNYLLLNNNGNTLLGFAFVENPRVGNRMNHLTLLATKQVYNKNGKKVRTGYGSQIMNALYNNAKAAGRSGVHVNHAAPSAVKFYKKKGYVENNNTWNMRRYVTPKSSPVRSPSSAKRKRGSPNRKSPN